MTSIKIVIGAAIVAFLAINIAGASVVLGGMSAFERVGDIAERYTGDNDDGPREFKPQPVEYRDDDFDGGDFDGGRNAESFQAPGRDFSGGLPAPGFFEGKGKGGKGEKGAWEMAYAVENASLGVRDAEDVALGEVSGRIVEAKLKGEDGFPHYEIEVLDGGGQLHEVLVEATDGSVMGRRIEDAEDSYEMSYLLDQASMDRQEAEDVAADAFPGRVVENKLGDENGFAVWEIKTFDEDGFLHEAEVSAQNGEILAYETKGG